MKQEYTITAEQLNELLEVARFARDINRDIKDYDKHPSQSALNSAYHASADIITKIHELIYPERK